MVWLRGKINKCILGQNFSDPQGYFTLQVNFVGSARSRSKSFRIGRRSEQRAHLFFKCQYEFRAIYDLCDRILFVYLEHQTLVSPPIKHQLNVMMLAQIYYRYKYKYMYTTQCDDVGTNILSLFSFEFHTVSKQSPRMMDSTKRNSRKSAQVEQLLQLNARNTLQFLQIT